MCLCSPKCSRYKSYNNMDEPDCFNPYGLQHNSGFSQKFHNDNALSCQCIYYIQEQFFITEGIDGSATSYTITYTLTPPLEGHVTLLQFQHLHVPVDSATTYFVLHHQHALVLSV